MGSPPLSGRQSSAADLRTAAIRSSTITVADNAESDRLMSYSKALARRISQQLERIRQVEEKKMFGGTGFLLNGNMCVGVWKSSLIVRVGLDQYEDALRQPNVGEFDITGRAMKGWVLVAPEGVENDNSLQIWIERAKHFVETLPAK